MEENNLSEFNGPMENPLSRAADDILNEIRRVVVGQDKSTELLIAGFLSGGHVLLEGVPGIAKTLMAKLLAKTIAVDFSRIQFTPDLMPSDVVGTSVFNLKTSEFVFNKGPVFSNVVLIDEINRSPAKTQAALFEVREERQITNDGVTYKLEAPFFIVATQNPIEQEGTYKLPEAQLDRFVFRIRLSYPTLTEEQSILRKFAENFSFSNTENVSPVMNRQKLEECLKLIEKVHIEEQLIDYIAAIVNATRNHSGIFLGASPRASIAILKTSKTIAAMRGRDFVTPEDIQTVTYPVLNHRIILTPEREIEGLSPEDIISEILQQIEVPR
jgi:MoxR-like ATPase